MTDVAQDQQVLCGWHVHSHCFLRALEGYFAHVKTKVLAVAICWYIVNYSQHNALVTLFFFLIYFLFFFAKKTMLFSLQDVFNESKLWRKKKRRKEKLESKFCSGHLDGFSLSCSPIPVPFFSFFCFNFFFWMGRKGKTERKRQRSMWGDRRRLCSDCNSITDMHM